MARYEYKGRSKIIERIPEKKINKQKFIINQCNFILIASSPMANVKSLGCALSNSFYDNEVMDIHLDLIKSICKNPFILVVGGFDSKKVLRHDRKNEFQLIENSIFEFTNSSEDLRIGLNAVPRGYTIVIDSAFIPSVETYKLLTEDINESRIAYSVRKSEYVGINTTSSDIVNYFGYSCEKRLKGAYSLSQLDSDKLRKRFTGSSFNKSKFDYEFLLELKLRGVEDNSKSLRIDENFEEEEE